MSYGIENIRLIENDTNVSITYIDQDTISAITGTTEFEFDACYSPNYETEIKQGSNRTDVYDRNLSLQLPTIDELTNVATILESYYGWLAVVTSQNESWVITDPLFLVETEENHKTGVVYTLELAHNVDSTQKDYEYQ